MLIAVDLLRAFETSSFSSEQKLKDDLLNLALKNVSLRRSTREGLQALVQNESVSHYEFQQKLVSLTHRFSWKVNIAFTQCLKAITSVSLINASLACVFFLVLLYLQKTYPKTFKSVQKKIFFIIQNLLLRLCTVFAYIFPIQTLFKVFLPVLLPSFPSLAFLVSFPVVKQVLLVFSNTRFIEYIYFYFVLSAIKCGYVTRILRFHLVRGLVIAMFVSVPYYISDILTLGFKINKLAGMYPGFNLFFFLLNVYFIIPGIVEAANLAYPKRWVIRESTEIMLGRETGGDTPFYWWDRKKKK